KIEKTFQNKEEFENWRIGLRKDCSDFRLNGSKRAQRWTTALYVCSQEGTAVLKDLQDRVSQYKAGFSTTSGLKCTATISARFNNEDGKLALAEMCLFIKTCLFKA